jgi:acetyl-CoA acetyltransferase
MRFNRAVESGHRPHGMNARTVMLWTAEEQKFFSEYGTDIDLGKRRGIAALCIGGGEAVALVVERVD